MLIIGGLHGIVGDHIGHCDILGLALPLCKYNSRLFTFPKDKHAEHLKLNDYLQNMRVAVYHKTAHHFLVQNKDVTNNKDFCIRLARSVGIDIRIKEVPAIYECKDILETIYLRSGTCELHCIVIS